MLLGKRDNGKRTISTGRGTDESTSHGDVVLVERANLETEECRSGASALLCPSSPRRESNVPPVAESPSSPSPYSTQEGPRGRARGGQRAFATCELLEPRSASSITPHARSEAGERYSRFGDARSGR